jgi:drug/metabolite transporter (DMT)-like permease
MLAFIWGWSFLFIKVALRGMTPATVAFSRVALGMIVMLGVLRIRGLHLPRDKRMWRHFAVMGLMYSAVPFTLLAWAEQHITSALTSVVNASTPLFAALAAAIALGERLKRPQVVGLFLGFAGVGVASGISAADLSGSSTIGVGAGLAASACYGFSFAYAQRHVVGIPPLVAANGQLVMATALTLPFAVLTSVRDGLHLEPRILLSIGLLGMVGTGFAYLLNYQSIADIGPTKASLVTYLVPVVAVALGVAFLGEAFHLRILLGGLLVVVGIALLQERLTGGQADRTITLATAQPAGAAPDAAAADHS